MKTLKERVLGAWTLKSHEVRDEQGSLTGRPFGEAPKGLLLYTAEGFMSAQLMRGPQAMPEVDSEQVLNSLAYAGRFEMDEASGSVHHHIQVSWFPAWVGQVQVRQVHFEGETLCMRTPAMRDAEGKMAMAEMRWVRA